MTRLSGMLGDFSDPFRLGKGAIQGNERTATGEVIHNLGTAISL